MTPCRRSKVQTGWPTLIKEKLLFVKDYNFLLLRTKTFSLFKCLFSVYRTKLKSNLTLVTNFSLSWGYLVLFPFLIVRLETDKLTSYPFAWQFVDILRFLSYSLSYSNGYIFLSIYLVIYGFIHPKKNWLNYVLTRN